MMKTTPTLTLLFLLFACTCVHAQKLEGTWKLIARKGDNPCAADGRVIFGPDGNSAGIISGGQFDGCPESAEDFDGWSVMKQEVNLRSGGKKNMKVISFGTGSSADVVDWIIIAYEKDYMRVQAEVYDGYDSTRPGQLIFKRIE